MNLSHGNAPSQQKAVRAKSTEWTQEPHPKGELWIGRINGEKVADVFAPSEGGRTPYYSLYLGALGPQYVDVASIESGKRAAQRALNKVVQILAR